MSTTMTTTTHFHVTNKGSTSHYLATSTTWQYALGLALGLGGLRDGPVAGGARAVQREAAVQRAQGRNHGLEGLPGEADQGGLKYTYSYN